MSEKAPNRNFYPSIGRGKKLWTDREIKAVMAGVRRFGEGRWSEIMKTVPYKNDLAARNATSIKDKFRSLKNQLKKGGI